MKFYFCRAYSIQVYPDVTNPGVWIFVFQVGSSGQVRKAEGLRIKIVFYFHFMRITGFHMKICYA